MRRLSRAGDRGERTLLWVLFAVTILLYLRSLAGAFVWDDRIYLLDNDILPTLQPWQVGRLFSGPTNDWGELLPLRDFLFVLEYHLFGTATVGYHVVSLLLYVLIGLAVHRLVLVFYRSRDTVRAEPGPSVSDGRGARAGSVLAVTALFMLHPCHVESVAYISGQKDLLPALFTFLAVRYLYEAHAQRRLLGRSAAIGVLFYYCSLLSKLTAVSTALFVPLLWLWARPLESRDLRRTLPFWLAVNLPVVFWVPYAFGFLELNEEFIAPLAAGEQVLRSIRILGAHTLRAIFPYPLNFGYPFDGAFSWDAAFAVGLGVLAALGIGLAWRFRSLATLGLCLFVVYLFPVLQLTHVVLNAGIYDRYLCVPVLGIAIVLERGVSLALRRGPGLRRALLGSTVVVLVALGVLTWSHIPRFASNVASLEHAYETFPGWRRAAFDYTYALVEAGRLDRASEVTESEATFSTPPWVRDYFRGWILLERSDTAAAVDVLTRASQIARLSGHYPFPDIPLARALIAQGRLESAQIVLEGVVRAPIHNPLGYRQARRLLAEIETRRQ